MMPITRNEIEILLDSPSRRDYVVSAYADLTVKDGFHDFVDRHLKNQARAAGAALSEAEARKVLEENLEGIRQAVMNHDPAAKGLAVFESAPRRLHHVVELDFPVENHLVIDEEPFVLPLLERWYGEPTYLVALVDSDEAHLFEAHAGAVERVRGAERPDADDEIQRDKPRFTYKKRFAQTQHEYLHGPEDDPFLKDVAAMIDDHFRTGRFTGLILLGHHEITGPLRKMLHRETQAAVVEAAHQAMTDKSHEVADEVARALKRWHSERDQQVLAELTERWKEHHLVADGATNVLDALQQGRAAQVIIGRRRDLPGARCFDCNYRFGAPVGRCPYCNGVCHTVNAVQEIMRLALRHRVPVHLFPRNLKDDPLERAGGVSALLRAEANWAPDAATAQASQGH
ncbi:MAG: host attachment protein [Isosphaeraceae bacterium]|nr:host attachment protein [Isosphaeraceae bacterium]